jgi:hypothetical protein
MDDPLMAIGEVARPREVDMDRCLGIETDRGVTAAGLSEVDLDR